MGLARRPLGLRAWRPCPHRIEILGVWLAVQLSYIAFHLSYIESIILYFMNFDILNNVELCQILESSFGVCGSCVQNEAGISLSRWARGVSVWVCVWLCGSVPT